MEILEHYGIDLRGCKVTIMGRSLVIGRPVAMMCMAENATVTICHSRTTPEDFAGAGKNADVVIAALGKAKMVKADMLGENQVIIDVGINEDEDGKMCGDVDFDQVEGRAKAITPVPGGVGSVTTAILMKHLLEAAS
jgi:methylenetetrahydrofolate dehydrogenase (NADP+)/methenyltetrahydrofolate cyclohydrolase